MSNRNSMKQYLQRRANAIALVTALAAICTLSQGCTTDRSAEVTDPKNTALKTVGPMSGATGIGMVATANPHATRAGEAILRAGGSAVDAAVAIEAVLSLVEPQSSGLGGGGFMVYYHADNQQISVYDGREKAPAGANESLFLDETGTPYGYLAAKNSGLSIGTPGIVAMLTLAQSERGSLPWNALFDDAIRLAEQGFEVSPRLRSLLDKYGKRLLPQDPSLGPVDSYAYFYDDEGRVRDQLTNQDYAQTLRALRENPRAMYEGDLAQTIVDVANTSPRPGTLSRTDLASYEARRLDPLCVIYRRWRACGPPPPSSWIAVGMTLGMLEASNFPTADRIADWKHYIQAQQLAYADRDYYIADDTMAKVPLRGLAHPSYLAQRAEIISRNSPSSALNEPGDPWPFENEVAVERYGRDTTEDYAGTTHFVVVDPQGNVVSMTASVESIFGSSRMAGGMFLNNQLTDFARQPRDADGDLVANHPAPGKRPRSSMSPTIVLDEENNFYLATGSPGGNSIIAYTLKTLVGVLDWNMTPQEAIELPNVVARGKSVRIESDRATPEFIAEMRDFGFDVKESEGENSGLSMIRRNADGNLEGGVDPRREGTIATVAAP